MGPDGREIRGEDMLLPSGRRRRADATVFAVRFHPAPDVEPTLTADKQGALLRIQMGPLCLSRSAGGALTIEDSHWVDGQGRPHPANELVVTGETDTGGRRDGGLLTTVSTARSMVRDRAC